MSLDYDLTAVPKANWQDADGGMSERTYCIIHSMEFMRMRSITADNYKELAKRQRERNAIDGTFGWNLNGQENYLFTDEDCQAYIGLTTNVTEYNDEHWKRFLNLQRVFTIFRKHNNNEVPRNNDHNGTRHFSVECVCYKLSQKENAEDYEFLNSFGKFVSVPDELGMTKYVYICPTP